MQNNNYLKNTVIIAAKNQAAISNRYIQRYGIDAVLYGTFQKKVLDMYGEVSYYAERSASVIRILPSFNISYAEMPYAEAGKVDELNDDTQIVAYARTTDNVKQGDIVEVDYSYFSDIPDKKYYKVDLVEIRAPGFIPISKKLIMSTHYLPTNIEDTNPAKIIDNGIDIDGI